VHEVNGSARRLRCIVALLLCLALLASGPSFAQEPPSQAPAPGAAEGADAAPAPTTASRWRRYAVSAVDILPIRVLGTSAVLIGFAAFVVSVPLVAPGGQMHAIRESWDYFVGGPVQYTFVRPLGDL
jgi:hypothetical protein